MKKSYVDKKGVAGESDRFVPKQPLIIKEGDDLTDTIFNRRKMTEMPFHLVHAEMIHELKKNALMDFHWIYQKLRATTIDE